jgi:hypothetical protein
MADKKNVIDRKKAKRSEKKAKNLFSLLFFSIKVSFQVFPHT